MAKNVEVKNLKDQWDLFVRERDEMAFRNLYEHYFHYLSFVGVKNNCSPDKAQDGIGDLFLYLWEQQPSLGRVRNHHTYLVTAFIRKIFRSEPFKITNLELDQQDIAALWLPSDEIRFIQKEQDGRLQQLLEDHIGQLPDRQKQILYQKFYLGLTYAQIAQANDLSIHTVYNTIYTALARLKDQIGEKWNQFLTGLIIIFFQL